MTVTGFDAVTVEHVADVAEVSPSSISRWFGTKESIVIWDEFDPQTVAAIDAAMTTGVVEHQVEPPTIDMHLPDEVGDLLAVADVEPGASRDARAGSGQLHPETFGSLMLDVGEPVPLGFHHPRTEATSQGRSTYQTQTRPSQAELAGWRCR
jgi:hypothetical protein